MQKTWIGLAFIAATATLGSAAAAVTPGKVEIFKDWTVGCDNGLDCEAVALMDPQENDRQLSVVVKRPAGPGSTLTIDMSTQSALSGRYSVYIDSKLLTRGMTEAPNKPIQLTGADALRLARAIARGNMIRMLDESGAEIGKASLAGTAAALRYMDAQQGRAGIRNAIIATAGKPKLGKKPALPIINALKITPTGILPDTSALVALSESSPCAAERLGSTEDTAYSLGNGSNGAARALVLLNCGAGAYNFSSGVYIAQRNSKGIWTFETAKFDYGATGFTAESAIPILVNASWEAEKQTITSYTKARGLGDCGSSESYIWDGEMFRLIAASFMGECRGSTDWIPTWRANVRFAG